MNNNKSQPTSKAKLLSVNEVSIRGVGGQSPRWDPTFSGVERRRVF